MHFLSPIITDMNSIQHVTNQLELYTCCQFLIYYFYVCLHINNLILIIYLWTFCIEVRQVPLPNNRLISTEAKSVTVKEQNDLKPAASETVSTVGAIANMKPATSSESKKSAKSEKKQGIVSGQHSSVLLFMMHLLICNS